MQATSAPQKKGFRTLAELSTSFQERQTETARLLLKLATEVQTAPVSLPEESEVSKIDQGTCFNTGTLRKVFQSKGFGFIAPVDGSQDVFVHFREMVNGDSKDLVVGTKCHFELQIDEKGNRKAKSVTLSKPQEVGTSSPESWSDTALQTYSRETLLAAFGVLCKADRLSKENPGVPGSMYMPRRETQRKRKSLYEEDPNLNDEQCIIKIEARLSLESGADVNNVITFGDSVMGGWSFEQALEANSKVGKCHFGLDSGDSTPTAAGDATSECEYASQDFSTL